MLEAIGMFVRDFPNPAAGPGDAPICMGGGLEPERLLAAYYCGYFPWYGKLNPILWWSPDPRCLLLPENFRLPSRSARYLRRHPFQLTFDAAFDQVIEGCAAPRSKYAEDAEVSEDLGAWLSGEMILAYKRMHALGYAHSVEAWKDGELAGGLYGMWLGDAFFGESMFHKKSEASRAALWGLVDFMRLNNCQFIDCQQDTAHMIGMGAANAPRETFLAMLEKARGKFGFDGAFRTRQGSFCYNPETASWLPWPQ